MLVSIYRKNGADTTLNGASSKFDRMVIKLPKQLTDEDKDKDDVLVIQPGYGDPKLLRAVPIKLYLNKARPMFGGNFCYTSDSRFPSKAPIKIFDRVEK